MDISFLVIDNFYDDPYAVHNAALHTDYARSIDGEIYPGDNSAEAVEVQGLNETVSRLLHEPVMGTPRTAHCSFRIATSGAESRAKRRVHVDRANHWAGIVYLTLPEHCQGGTEFYRHKELASDHAPLYDSDVAQSGKTCVDFTQDLLERDSNDPSKWEHLFTIPMRFNRCILFRPWFWHAPGESFGDCGENARMIQMFFFSVDPSKLQGSRPPRRNPPHNYGPQPYLP